MSFRQLKKELSRLLSAENPESLEDQLLVPAGRRMVNPLFSLFLSKEEMLRWRAVTAMGMVVSGLAEKEMESARVVMRRLMWTLNDESGGIGWGSPEAMGEIMARNKALADEYACILLSYINEGGNYLEHEVLQRGVLWGVGRLARAYPPQVTCAAPHLAAWFDSPDPFLRGLSLWAALPLKLREYEKIYSNLLSDSNIFSLFENDTLSRPTISLMAEKALSALKP